jgi:hypothetical protein
LTLQGEMSCSYEKVNHKHKHEILNPKQMQMFKTRNKDLWGESLNSSNASSFSVWDIALLDF